MYNIDTEWNALICKKCGRFYQACPRCSDNLAAAETHEKQADVTVALCQFIGANDYRKDEDDGPHLDFSQKDIDYVKNEDIESITGEKMTGPDGGMYLYWKCRLCKKSHTTCDK